jgi:hypothetical protein
MGEWRVRVLGPEYQIGAAVECLSGSGWAIEQSGDNWYMKSAQRQWVGDGSLVAEEAEREIERINLVYRLFNPNDSALLTLGPHSFVREDGTRSHFLTVTTSIPIESGLTTTLNTWPPPGLNGYDADNRLTSFFNGTTTISYTYGDFHPMNILAGMRTSYHNRRSSVGYRDSLGFS